MDTRRCALFLIKCVQGFAAIFRKWMTWKCNFQCISLLLQLKRSLFLSHESPFVVVHQKQGLSFLCRVRASSRVWPYASYVSMCITIGVCMSSYLACMCLTYLPGHQRACFRAAAVPHSAGHPSKTRPHPNQRLFLDTMPSP